MQNQFQTETIHEQSYTPLAAPQTASAKLQTQNADNTQIVHEWLATAKRKVRHNKISTGGIYAGIGACALIPFVLGSSLADKAQYVLIAGLPFMGVLFFLRYRTLAAKPIWSAEELDQVKEVEAIGTLIDLTGIIGANRDFATLHAALTSLLPQIKASDAARLTAEQRGMLYRTLDYGSNMPNPPVGVQEYLLAILKTLGQIGDASALPIVTRLANRRAVTVSQQKIKSAAQQCLPALQMRLTEMEAAHTLLRGTSPEQSSQEQLLRPAAGTPDPNSQQLLRAAEISSSILPVDNPHGSQA